MSKRRIVKITDSDYEALKYMEGYASRNDMDELKYHACALYREVEALWRSYIVTTIIFGLSFIILGLIAILDL